MLCFGYDSVAQCPPGSSGGPQQHCFILIRMQVIIFIYILNNINCAALMFTYNDVSS